MSFERSPTLTKPRRSLLAATKCVGAAAFLTSACSGAPDGDAPRVPAESEEAERAGAADGAELVWYRGNFRKADRFGDILIIEGDIQVGASDVPDRTPGQSRELGIAQQALRRQGASFRWTGRVPYWFGSTNDLAAGGTLAGALDPADASSVEAALDEWEAAVPGLSFVERTNETDYIEFNLATICSSSVGRQGGKQIVRLTARCAGTHSAHHEIGHALGLFHQHTRKDRDAFVTINWGSVRGCNSTATGPTAAEGCGVCTTAATAANCGCSAAQVANRTCNRFSNFVTNGSRADIGDYDYGSVMHYGSREFAWGGGDSITATEPIGQRNRLSHGDVQAMRAMYPTAQLHRVFFADTGERQLCRLMGRDGDRRGTRFDATGELPRSRIRRGVLDTQLEPGDYEVACEMTSTFWAQNYNYPNSTTDFNNLGRGSNVETYAAGTSVRVLGRGVIAVLL